MEEKPGDEALLFLGGGGSAGCGLQDVGTGLRVRKEDGIGFS